MCISQPMKFMGSDVHTKLEKEPRTSLRSGLFQSNYYSAA